ncbi:GNAT family protein [Actinomadura viridis]|uniref:RimJ/RimL family protein N-acetyltransferase n=1 Tax=Actinomadura viridis TaxID=58110 RepID=A0A931GGP4_9ACTN|nr:GNAT family protein [Actinomadura viridis]MBG6086555.1 RimJ/RimL family protein N-acetyltransferase [Actinomadura viridis]
MFASPLAEDAEIRPLEPWQAEEFAEHVVRVRADISPWIPWAATITDASSAREFLEMYARRQAADQGRLYGIWIDGVLQGGTVFRTFDPVMLNCEIGVWMGAAGQGRGLVTRAARQMIDWAFGVRGMARVEWHCDPENARSVAAAERLGLTCEGTLREAFVMNGERRGVQIWSLLADEWRAA